MILIFCMGAVGLGILSTIFGLYRLFLGISFVNLLIAALCIPFGLYIIFSNSKFIFEFLYPKKAALFYTKDYKPIVYNESLNLNIVKSTDTSTVDLEEKEKSLSRIDHIALENKHPYSLVDEGDNKAIFHQSKTVYFKDKAIATFAMDYKKGSNILLWKGLPSGEPQTLELTVGTNNSLNNVIAVSEKTLFFLYGAVNGKKASIMQYDLLNNQHKELSLNQGEELALGMAYDYFNVLRINESMSLFSVNTSPIPKHATSTMPGKKKFYIYDDHANEFLYLFDLTIRFGAIINHRMINNMLYFRTHDPLKKGSEIEVWQVDLSSVL